MSRMRACLEWTEDLLLRYFVFSEVKEKLQNINPEYVNSREAKLWKAWRKVEDSIGARRKSDAVVREEQI